MRAMSTEATDHGMLQLALD